MMEENLKSVKMHTAGIIPHHVKVPGGNIILYDLAGHYQYYSSHSSCLETISSQSPSTFLLLSDLSKGIDVMKSEYNYWCSLVGNVSKGKIGKEKQQSSVILVGTHVDKFDPEELSIRCKHFEQSSEDILNKYNLSFIQFFALDSRAYQNQNMKRFLSTLYETIELVKKRGPPISLSCHTLYAFLKALNMDAITLSELLSRLAQEEEQSLPTNASDISSLLSTLSDRGLITFFYNHNPSDSWIVIKPETLLSEIIGVLFAPKFFSQYRHLRASNIGLVPVSVLQREFRKYNVDMILQFLIHFELCQNIVGTMFTSGSVSNECQHEECVFFPAFVDAKRPSKVTADATSLVWKMCTSDITQFYTVRFLHVLILRLAEKFPLHLPKYQQDPAFHPISRQCEVWSMGISWNNELAVTTIFEMDESLQSLSLTIDSPDKNAQSYLHLLKSVIEAIKSTCREFCPFVAEKTTERYVCPREAGGPAEVDSHCLQKAVRAKAYKTVDITGEKIDLNIWKTKEPQLAYIIGVEDNEGLFILQSDVISAMLVGCNTWRACYGMCCVVRICIYRRDQQVKGGASR